MDKQVLSFFCKFIPSTSYLILTLQLLLNLRDIRTLLGGDILDGGCNILRKKIGSKITKKLDGSPLSTHKVRSLVKALILIAANLSQSREFRDLFEDLQAKVI